MHHGDGLLEYFWSKCQEQGNPKGLSASAFRYPGVPPQSRETAILCICDAVEAASRTLKQPDGKAIEALVQRIVYGKLHLGQLDESGLSVADLKILAATLVENLKHAHHVRIEYPWQREERARAAAAGRPSDQMTVPGTPESRVAAQPTVSLSQPRVETARMVSLQLDSADAPRPTWPPAEPLAVTTAPGFPAEPLPPGSKLPTPPAIPVADAPFSEALDDAVPRPRATTVELLKDAASQSMPIPAMEALAPGTLVIGAPPVTNPRLPVLERPERPDERALTDRDRDRVPEVVDESTPTGPIVTPAIPPASMTPPRRRRPPTPPRRD
jgi:hypothetical protein